MIKKMHHRWLEKMSRLLLGAIIVAFYTFAGAAGNSCIAITATALETLETRVTVRVSVAITFAHLQLARSVVSTGSVVSQGIAWLGRRLNAVVVVCNTFAGATGDRCCATTLETLETLVAVRVIVAVTLAKLQRARSGVGIGSEIFQGWLGRLGWRNAVVVVCNTFAGATGDRCCATTLETLETPH